MANGAPPFDNDPFGGRQPPPHGHFRIECGDCKTLITQCRCADPGKPITVSRCAACMRQRVAAERAAQFPCPVCGGTEFHRPDCERPIAAEPSRLSL